jgi:hypothetical protein
LASRAEQIYIAEVGVERGTAEVANILAGVDSKILLVHSYDDEAAPYARAEAASQTLNAPLLLFPGLTHRGVAQDRDVIERAIEFIAAP